jgi:hypothetical protein
LAKTLFDVLMGKVFDRTLETVLKPSVPVPDSAAPQVAHEVTSAVKPIIENATNSEPWYKSRIYIGLIVAGVGAIAQHFGVQVSGSDLKLITDSVPELIQLVGSAAELIGILYATYGRIVGASKPPIGG